MTLGCSSLKQHLTTMRQKIFKTNAWQSVAYQVVLANMLANSCVFAYSLKQSNMGICLEPFLFPLFWFADAIKKYLSLVC